MIDTDESRHAPGPEQLWSESWYFDFTTRDGDLGGWIRIGLYPNLGVAWYHAFLVGERRPCVAVIDHAVTLPKAPSLEIRAEGLWADHICEAPWEHWSVANEAFGVAVDEPAELYGRGLGDRVPLAFDLEWELAGSVYDYVHTTRYEAPCTVHGEILVGDEQIDFDGVGQRDHSWGVRDWWQFGWVWSSGALDDGARFHGSDIRISDVDIGFGYVQPGVESTNAVHAAEALGPEGFATEATIEIGGVELAIAPVAFAPVLLEGPEGQRSRFPRALCRFSAADGRTGVGWTEWNQPEGLNT